MNEARWAILVAVLNLMVNTVMVIQNRKPGRKRGRHRR